MLAFSGWMDGGDVSTGTVEPLVELTRGATDCRDRSRAVLHLQLPRLDGGRRAVPAAYRDRRRAWSRPSRCRRTRSIATNRPTWCCSSARSRTCNGGRSASASFEPGQRRRAFAAFCSSARSAARSRTLDEPRLVRHLLRGTAAARDGAIRHAPHRLRRPRLVHQLPDDPGPLRQSGNGLAGGRESPVICRAPTR